jgi:hypothetical protein
VQDTGLRGHLPLGEGLLVFDDVAGAQAALAEIERDRARHARAAEELAARYFDSDRVLTQLLDIAGV